MTEQTSIDFAGRDRVLSKLQRRQLCQWLEWECAKATGWMNDNTTTPVSANTARAILRAHGIELKDTRILGGVFPSARWYQVGEIHSDSGKCHARKIRQFLPRYPIQATLKPEWCGG